MFILLLLRCRYRDGCIAFARRYRKVVKGGGVAAKLWILMGAMLAGALVGQVSFGLARPPEPPDGGAVRAPARAAAPAGDVRPRMGRAPVKRTPTAAAPDAAAARTETSAAAAQAAAAPPPDAAAPPAAQRAPETPPPPAPAAPPPAPPPPPAAVAAPAPTAIAPSPYISPRAEPVGSSVESPPPPVTVPPPPIPIPPPMESDAYRAESLVATPGGQVFVAPPSRSPCIDLVCAYLGPTMCDSLPELRAAARVCEAQLGAACIRTVCQRAGRLACTQLDELAYAADACIGALDGSCVDTVCERLGALGCSNLYKASNAARACTR
jgi:hypothetical protein